MRGCWLVVALAAVGGCGRFGFDSGSGGGRDAARDAGEPGGISVIADWSALNPYDSQDFQDGTVAFDNHPVAVSALTAPFPAGFVVAAGRRLIELPMTGAAVVHDFRPSMFDQSGPDEIVTLTVGAVPGLGGLFAGSTSLLDGDGLYVIDSAWQISRDQTTNNVGGIAIDATGAFDGIGTPTLYFTGGSKGVYRRDTQAMTPLVATFPGDLERVKVTPTEIDVVDSITDGQPERLWRIDPGTHAKTQLDTVVGITLAEGDVPASGLIAVRELKDVVRYHFGGTFDVLASSPDPHSLWLDATIPSAPHPLAGRIVVLEWNTDTDTQRLLLLPP